MKLVCAKMLVRALPVLALGAFAGAVHADQEVKSSDGMWMLHAKVADVLAVKKSSDATIKAMPEGMAKGCPTVSSVAFEMPSHGHGGSVEPKAAPAGECTWKITDLNPSMAGDWRLRVVLKNGDKTSNADFSVMAK